MSKSVWKNMSSLDITPSYIILWDYDGFPYQPKGIYQNVPIELVVKIVLIDIEVIDTPLDYNILLGHIYMYVMKEFSSSIF